MATSYHRPCVHMYLPSTSHASSNNGVFILLLMFVLIKVEQFDGLDNHVLSVQMIHMLLPLILPTRVTYFHAHIDKFPHDSLLSTDDMFRLSNRDRTLVQFGLFCAHGQVYVSPLPGRGRLSAHHVPRLPPLLLRARPNCPGHAVDNVVPTCVPGKGKFMCRN